MFDSPILHYELIASGRHIITRDGRVYGAWVRKSLLLRHPDLNLVARLEFFGAGVSSLVGFVPEGLVPFPEDRKSTCLNSSHSSVSRMPSSA